MCDLHKTPSHIQVTLSPNPWWDTCLPMCFLPLDYLQGQKWPFHSRKLPPSSAHSLIFPHAFFSSSWTLEGRATVVGGLLPFSWSSFSCSHQKTLSHLSSMSLAYLGGNLVSNGFKDFTHVGLFLPTSQPCGVHHPFFFASLEYWRTTHHF